MVRPARGPRVPFEQGEQVSFEFAIAFHCRAPQVAALHKLGDTPCAEPDTIERVHKLIDIPIGAGLHHLLQNFTLSERENEISLEATCEPTTMAARMSDWVCAQATQFCSSCT